MSVEAITWALSRPIKHSTAKFVLVVMANCADGQQWLAWPSVAYLAEATGQDRKTVLENIKRLTSMGYLQDTGERKGATKQVIVYRLAEPVNSAENGTVEESQKRDSTESGTVPNFPPKSPVFPGKQSQISRETVPKTGHGTVKEPSEEPSGNRQKARAGDYPEDFDHAWSLYPRHAGASKKDAFKAWAARIKQGATAEEMIDGARRYAAYVKALKTEERYMKQPETFFGPGDHFRTKWTIPKSAETAAQREERIRREFLDEDAEADDGMTIEMED